MAQVSEVTIGDLHKQRRMDAEYFKADYLHFEDNLQRSSHISLNDIAYVTDGDHGSPDFDEESEIIYLSAKTVKDNCFDLSAVETISKDQDERNKRSRLKNGDIILSTVGTIGNVAVVTEDMLPGNMDRHVGLIRLNDNSNNRAFFYSMFLSSKYGRFQSLRHSTGNVQLNLFISKITQFLAPAWNDKCEAIGSITRSAYELRKKSHSLLKDAEAVLLSELGLEQYLPEHTLVYETDFDSILEDRRMDAEYYQPKYAEAIKRIKTNHRWELLKDVTTLVGHPSNPPYASDKDQNQTFIITQKHLADYFPKDNFWEDEDALYTTSDFISTKPEYILQEDDILLYSVGAYIGKANIFTGEIPATLGSFLTLIRADKSKINPYYLVCFLNSKIGNMLTRRNQKGLAQQYVYPYDIQKFVIPIPSNQIQEQIETLIVGARNSLSESKKLLSDAKKQVETMIEEKVKVVRAAQNP